MELSLHWADYVIFALFLAVSLGIGVYHACTGGKQKTTKEFIMADRKLQILPTVISILVSNQSAIMIIGLTAEMFNYGSQLWMVAAPLGYPLAILATERVIVPWLYPLKLTSAYSYLGIRFQSLTVRMFGTLLGLVNGLLYIGTAMYAPSIALETATGFPMVVSIPLMAVATTAYTTLGGMRAVIWTDVFQGVIMYTGMLTILIKGAVIVGGFGSAMDLLEDAGRHNHPVWSIDPRLRHTFWTLSIGYATNWCFHYGLSQASVQRYCATKTLRHARMVLLLNIPAAVLLESISCMMGVVCVAYYYSNQCDPIASGQVTMGNQILPLYVQTVFASNKGFAGLFLATLYSGALSTVSSALSGCAANAWEDILKFKLGHLSEKRAAAINRSLVVLFGLIGTAFAFMSATLPGPVTQVTTALMSAVMGPLMGMFVLGGVFRLAEWRGTLVGGAVSLVINLWLNIGANSIDGLQQPLPSLPVDGCSTNSTLMTYDSENTTNITLSPIEDHKPSLSGLDNFYALSYQYYALFGCLVTLPVGLLSSFIFRRFWPEKEMEDHKVRDELFINWRSMFTFGEKRDESKVTEDKDRENASNREEIEESAFLKDETANNHHANGRTTHDSTALTK